MMILWNRNTKASWYGNVQWTLASGVAAAETPTRLDVFGSVEQAMFHQVNVPVKWKAQHPWMIAASVSEPAPAIMALERATFRRIFGRIFGRVN
jgi:hypothetical protein